MAHQVCKSFSDPLGVLDHAEADVTAVTKQTPAALFASSMLGATLVVMVDAKARPPLMIGFRSTYCALTVLRCKLFFVPSLVDLEFRETNSSYILLRPLGALPVFQSRIFPLIAVRAVEFLFDSCASFTSTCISRSHVGSLPKTRQRKSLEACRALFFDKMRGRGHGRSLGGWACPALVTPDPFILSLEAVCL